jgi:hypothetical protein
MYLEPTKHLAQGERAVHKQKDTETTLILVFAGVSKEP